MRKRMLVIATGAVVVAGLAGGGIAWATGVGDRDHPLRGKTLERATAAALRHTGGGTVVEAEQGDDGAAYGVEVRLPDGRQVEVNLDASFQVLGQARDDDGAGEKQDQESGDD